MGIHMKLKDRRTFLLGGAFLLFLLLFAMMSSVAAADTANDTELVNVSQINHIIVYDNEEVLVNNTADNIIIKNDYDKSIDLRNVTSDIVLIKNSEPRYIRFYNSTINTLILDNVTLDSWLFVSLIQDTTINEIIIINSDIKHHRRSAFSIDDSDIKYISLIDSHVHTVKVRDSIIEKVSYTSGSTLSDITKENATIENVSERL